jgi:hypothetical protein
VRRGVAVRQDRHSQRWRHGQQQRHQHNRNRDEFGLSEESDRGRYDREESGAGGPDNESQSFYGLVAEHDRFESRECRPGEYLYKSVGHATSGELAGEFGESIGFGQDRVGPHLRAHLG